MNATTAPPATLKAAIVAGFIMARENYEGRHQLALYKRHCKRTGRPLVTLTPGRKFATVGVFWKAADMPPGWALAIEAARAALDVYGRSVTPSGALIGPHRVPIPEALAIAAALGKAAVADAAPNAVRA